MKFMKSRLVREKKNCHVLQYTCASILLFTHGCFNEHFETHITDLKKAVQNKSSIKTRHFIRAQEMASIKGVCVCL